MDASPDRFLRGPDLRRLHPQSKSDVLEDRQMAEERVVLEDEADAALGGAAIA